MVSKPFTSGFGTVSRCQVVLKNEIFISIKLFTPVHLKRGVMDKMLYRTTMGLTIGGTLYCLMALYIAAQPRKPQ
uniref:Uncharacterized protein n=1 Tax=Cyprinus carpio TaxID=7962 RepID=A0A8C1J7G0_CYPCA